MKPKNELKDILKQFKDFTDGIRMVMLIQKSKHIITSEDIRINGENFIEGGL